MNAIQNEIIALISSFDVSFSVRTGALENGVRAHVYLNRMHSPEYRKCRNALRKTYGLTPLWDKKNLSIGPNDTQMVLCVMDDPYKRGD